MIRTRYNPHRVKVNFALPSLCQSHFQRDTDVNDMIRRALVGDRSVFRSMRYFDASNAPSDFHDAQSRIALARSAWEDLPDKVKVTFGSPEEFLAAYDREVLKDSVPSNSSSSKSDDKKENGVTVSPTNSTMN